MKVFVVLASWPYEGDGLCSIWATEELANAECKLRGEHSRYTDFRVEEWDVGGAAKEKAPESSDPEACYLCKRDYLKCRCIPL